MATVAVIIKLQQYQNDSDLATTTYLTQ